MTASPPAPTPSNATPSAWGLSWPLLIFVLAWLWAIALPTQHPSLGDPDTYWHLAAGRWILAHQAVPNGDPFSHSMPGAAWTAHEWLTEVIFAKVHAWAGWSGLVALAALAFAAMLAYVTRFLLRRMEPIHALLFVMLTAFLTMSHLLARPHILAWPLIVLWFGSLIDAVETRHAPPWWLPAVMVLWANLHGSFTLGLVLGGALAAEALWLAAPGQRLATLKPWARFMLLAALASLATPHGWNTWLFTLHVMSLSLSLKVIGEWKSADFQRLQPLEIWLLLVFALALLGRFKLTLPRTVLLLGLLHMALKHSRYASMLGMVGTLLIAAPLARTWAASATTTNHAAGLDRLFALLAQPARRATLAVALGLAVAAAAALGAWRGHRPLDNVTPATALQAARTAGAGQLPGAVLNSYNFGGYLIEQGVPVFIDGRADMYGDDFVRAFLYATGLHTRAALLELLDKHRIGWTLLTPGTPAIAVLDALPGWRRVHDDSIAVVHVRAAETGR